MLETQTTGALRELRRVTTTNSGKKILLDSSYSLDKKNCR